MMRLFAQRVPSRFVPGAVLLTAAVIAACKPWTVRPIEEPTSTAGGSAVKASPTEYVASIWDAKVVPAVNAGAVDLAPLLEAAPQSTSRLVKAIARVVTIDRTSRAGLAHLDVLPADGRIDAALQIGPVVRGTALRDALPFMKFDDFVNQIEFAEVANALNDRALRSALKDVALGTLEGRLVSFVGAVRLDPRRSGVPEIVPVRLRLVEGMP